jgi:hypothetical protein
MGKANLVYGKPVVVRHTEAATHLAGDVIVIGATPFVAHVDVPSFTGGTLTDALAAGGGVYQMTANGALTLGQDVWWDPAAGKISGVSVNNVHFGIIVAGPLFDLGSAGPAADGDLCHVLHCPEGFTPYSLPGIKAEATVSITATLTVTQLLNGFVNSAPAGAITLTTPTAAAIVAAMKGAKVGDSFECVIENTSGGANAITLAAGAGVTLRGGTAVAQNKAAILKGVLTNVTAAAEAVTLYSVVGA